MVPPRGWKYQESNAKLRRSANYRESYFNAHPGREIFRWKFWFCSYCGKVLWNKKSIEIDHIHSVRRVQYTRKLRERYKTKPAGVNDLSNLTAACRRCNRRKGKQGGLWVLLGRYGQHFMPQLRLSIQLLILYVIVARIFPLMMDYYL